MLTDPGGGVVVSNYSETGVGVASKATLPIQIVPAIIGKCGGYESFCGPEVRIY